MRKLLDRCRAVVKGVGKPPDHGFILIVVISAIGILALVAVSFAQITNSHVRAAASAVQSAGAETLADAGVQLAILDLVANRQASGPQPRRFALNGTALACDAGNGNRLIISVQDEAGKVDVNVADERLIGALLAGLRVQASGAIADAILDFRDTDANRRPQGAERADYLAAGRSQGPKNASLSVVDELEQVLGLNAADVAGLRPHVTVYSGQTGIEESSATAALLAILSRGRARAGGFTMTTEEAEPDDRVRQLPAQFVGGAGGRFFSVRSEAHAGRAIFVREAIVELGRSRVTPFTLHRWFRGALARTEQPAAAEADPLPPC
jgi:general secretion pathway protein K